MDVTNLDIGDSIKIRDLKIAEEIIILDRPDSAVAAVAVIKVAKIEEPVKEEGAVEEGAEAQAEGAATTVAAQLHEGR